jgi:putative hemolysin
LEQGPAPLRNPFGSNPSVTFEIVVVLLLILLNGFFAMSELAVLSSKPAKLRQMAENGRRGAHRVLALLEDPNRFLSTVQIGITLVGIFAGAYSGATLGDHLAIWLEKIPLIAPYADAAAIALVVMAITYLSLIVGELVPKRLALTNPEGIALAVAPVMAAVSSFGGPVVWFLGKSTEIMLRLFGVRGMRGYLVTHEELSALIAEGTRSGVFEPAEKEMIERVLKLADRPVVAIMTPRPDVIWFDINDDLDAIRRKIALKGHSRYVVSDGKIEEFLGITQTKDILEQLISGQPFDLRKSLREPLVIPENTRILRMLDTFRQTGRHIAIVVDEYGGLEGIVSITDILESIAGDLPHAGSTADSMAVRQEDGSWLVDGAEAIHDVERLVGLRAMSEDADYHTLAGFVLNQLQHLPELGEYFTWQGIRFEVVDMDGRRIDRVLISPPRASESED